MSDEKFRLTEVQKRHPLWLDLKTWALSEIETLRMRFEKQDMTTEKTAELRGQIRSLRNLLLLEDEPPLID